MKTTLQKTSEVKRLWHEIDASKQVLGRLATHVAMLLRGKQKAIYTPSTDGGDFVVVINADKVQLTGRKLDQKEYIRFTGYPGGIRREKMRTAMEKYPDKVIWRAVRDMLPTNKLRQKQLGRLRVVPGDKHTFKIDKKA